MSLINQPVRAPRFKIDELIAQVIKHRPELTIHKYTSFCGYSWYIISSEGKYYLSVHSTTTSICNFNLENPILDTKEYNTLDDVLFRIRNMLIL
jgi:hypothetical protein